MDASSPIDDFLDRLEREGYAIGIRDRLVVHAYLERLAAVGDLPDTLRERLRLLQPLISRNEREQQRFGPLVNAFLPGEAEHARERTGDRSSPPVKTRARRWRFPRRAALLSVAPLLLTVLLLGVWRSIWRDPVQATERKPVQGPIQAPIQGPVKVGNDPAAQEPPGSLPFPGDRGAMLPSVYVPAGSFADSFFDTPAAEVSAIGTVAIVAGILIGIAVLVFASSIGGQRLRQMYLQSLNTDEDLESHLLLNAAPPSLAIPEAQLRVVSRMLRQRIAGARQEFDIHATLQATLRAGGAIVPRHRPTKLTPEYLVLIDRISPVDHQAKIHELVVRALQDQGIAIDFFEFEGSPGDGCWRVRFEDGPAGPRSLVGFGQLASRYAGHRLLIFGAVDSAFDPVTGEPAPWTRAAGAFANRAWFTPLSIASWGGNEAALDSLSFLVLPMEVLALTTLGEWLGSERATLQADADWPGSFPPSLRGGAAAWVARQVPPPMAARVELLEELRRYLGPVRFQWLCACAVFPGLTWTLTVSLGHEVLGGIHGAGKPDALIRGIGALGALPWFRYGRMPNWLRNTLLDQLEPGLEVPVRTLVERRLAETFKGRTGTPLTEVAIRRRVKAWLFRGTGFARDVILAGFLEKGESGRLAQRIPERVRRMLFNEGSWARGVREDVMAITFGTAALLGVSGIGLLLAGLAAAPWMNDYPYTSLSQPPLEPYAELHAHTGVVNRALFSPDGRLILSVAADSTARLWPVGSTGTEIRPLITLRHSRSVVNAAFSPDGNRFVTAVEDGSLWYWSTDGRRLDVFAPVEPGQVSVEFSPDGQHLLTVSDRGLAVLRNLNDPLRTNELGRTVRTAEFSPDGLYIGEVFQDGSVALVSVGSFRARSLPRWISAQRAESVRFSPDGKKLLVVSRSGVEIGPVDRNDTLVSRRLRFTETDSVAVLDARFSPDGRSIITVSYGGTTNTWSVADGGLLASFDQSYGPASAAFTPDGRQVLISSDTGWRLWHSDGTGDPIRLDAAGFVRPGLISPDGKRILGLGVNRDSVVQIWGERSGIAVGIASCQGSPRNDRQARTIADSLADAGYQRSRFSPVAYGPGAWSGPKLGTRPGAGEIRYTAADTLPRGVVSWLGAAVNRWLGTPADWRAVEEPAGRPVIAVGTCAADVDSFPPVYIYYKDVADTTVARGLATELSSRGYSVVMVALRPRAAATDIESVRYFRSEDGPLARRLGLEIARFLASAGRKRSTLPTANRADPNVQRHIEIWIPPEPR